jgi:NAD(P)H-nitrite reductase large subunit
MTTPETSKKGFEMKEDILEKGAIIQRDKETFAVAPHIPGGFISVGDFRKMVDTADKYHAAALKVTSGQRIAVIGLAEKDLDAFWRDSERSIGYALGLCVRMVKFCPGTTYCRHGKQDAMGVGAELDRRHHGRMLSAKFKIGVAGCEYACNAPRFKEVGLLGLPDGWQVSIGGTCGAKPRFGDIVAEKLDDANAITMTDNIIKWYESGNFKPKVRMGRIIEELGLDQVKKAIGI